MKYSIFGICAAIVMVCMSIGVMALDSESESNRYHQHLESRQPDAGCDCDGTELCTHLPLVLIETQEVIPGLPIRDETGAEVGYTTTSAGEEMLRARISVISDESTNHHPSDEPDLESEIMIRVRGNSSRYFDKSSYLVRLIEEDGTYRSEEMMGMAPHYEWAMHGPYLDKSLIRNYMWYNITAEFMDYAPNVRFCEVILNGEYQGLYVMTETITNGEDCRVDISEPVENTTITGYVLRQDRGSHAEIRNITTFTNYSYRNLQKINIQYPRTGSLTPELVEAIEQDFSDFEKSLYSYDYDTSDYGYQHDIDVQSFIDYFLINEFTVNYDAGWLSTYLYKDIGGKYRMVIWDFNSSCDNYSHTLMDPQHFETQYCTWYYMLMKDERFIERMIERYQELRQTYLSDEYLNQYIDDIVAYLGDAIDRNFEVWGYTFDDYMISPDERNPNSHEEAIQQIKDFIAERGAWMDENIEILKQYGHESKNKKFNH
ncbi:CotH kinase family protein [Anaerotignum lactatifermentans]|uniref:CotH kinase family protein n=1 Tax=Anaerotignum lactatifermentans TaxID=160404 RepID=A0ABS2GDP9_9FIRM|nr:CotH kinase family protein [Anaerotignum lactatifermentans]MBM6830185.1 CotH kinase family protein [Anaerotignum lactatifermentans]MBM6878742.1 CotH kinase family protein [Anaerotignum lactatifermentans]MBM6951806.1 CotH kinase family protein [Anaerotignum lactatifermentans]